MGLLEGRDFVKNTAPPSNFAKSQYQPLNYKNVITHKSGHSFIIASNDRPGLVNSLSITGGIFVDECRFINGELMKQDLYPAIRGKNVWGKNNPFVFSSFEKKLVTINIPNANNNKNKYPSPCVMKDIFYPPSFLDKRKTN